MTVTAEAWTSAPSSTPAVSLMLVPPDVLDALANGELERSRELSGLELSPYLTDEGCRGVWRRRCEQIAKDPRDAIWLTRVVVDMASGKVVGRAGFHGRPDGSGMIEVGYSIDPGYRRQGFARAALTAMLDIVASDSRVAVVRASIRPDNVASLRLVEQYGFQVVGRQWDDEDGWETILELGATG